MLSDFYSHTDPGADPRVTGADPQAPGADYQVAGADFQVAGAISTFGGDFIVLSQNPPFPYY